MNKNQTLQKMQDIRKVHVFQTDKILAAITGQKIDKPTALNSTECEFGKWLYDENNRLKDLWGSIFFNDIETIHAQWHKEYAKLFEILFKKKKKGLFSKMMNLSDIDPLDLDKAKLYYVELKETTSQLLKLLYLCEKRVSALNEEKFH
ncbi:CZB domain-containing protein [Sulfurospirillum arcachonense]|uniref:CZB domain-containing protein n=1 Tax=Sulfurospirillum arcachonense TaxID=57666 RepID=UPI0004691522|nr:CZB domain-containing protein [Sulfurospirillum arcachonense]